MRLPYRLLASLLLCLPTVLASAAPAPAQATIDELVNNIRARRAAVERGDVAAWKGYVADDSIWTDASAERGTKAEVLEALPAQVGSVHVVEAPEVRLAGNVAVVSYIDVERAEHNGKEVEIRQSILETHVRRAGRWLLLAQSETRIAPPVVDPPAVHVAPAVLDAYVGTYRWNDHQTLSVYRDGERLMFKAEHGEPADEVFAENETTFFSKGQRWRQIFVRGADGRVDLSIYRDNGVDAEMPRVK
ncbi:MAG: DUF4440 domain-containing protein [Proteobacteria bacterium]|nr:DUF4440 domain-containing protein [Pseudomonadota bacterium]